MGFVSNFVLRASDFKPLCGAHQGLKFIALDSFFFDEHFGYGLKFLPFLDNKVAGSLKGVINEIPHLLVNETRRFFLIIFLRAEFFT